MTSEEAQADLAAWLAAGSTLTPQQWADYRHRLAAYRKTTQNELPLQAPKEEADA